MNSTYQRAFITYTRVSYKTARYARRLRDMPKDQTNSAMVKVFRREGEKDFSDVVLMDHCEIKHMAKKHQLFQVLDGTTNSLWGATQNEGTEPATQDLFREGMHNHSCKPKWVEADVGIFTHGFTTKCRAKSSSDKITFI